MARRVSVTSSETGQAGGATITVTFPGGAFPAAPRSGDLAARTTSASTTRSAAGRTYDYEFVLLPT